MKKIFLKYIISIGMLITTILLLSTISNAANLTISTSKSTVSPGETFTVTVSLNGAAGPVSASTSNGSGALGSQWLENSSASFSCTAGNSGTVTISASGTVGDFSTGDDINVSASKSVTISAPTTKNTTTTKTNTTTTTPKVEEKKSNDSSLSALSIEEGTISPEFNKDTREYTLSVPNEITALNVKATVNNSKATYSVKGNEELQVGENIVTINVKAEDGSSSNYIIKVIRAREELALKTLTVKYIDENNEAVELLFTPTFVSNIYEYNLGEIEYNISKLDIEALTNLEGATVEIEGNENLQEGENTITIIVKIPKEVTEGEDQEDEIKTYTLMVNKKPEPIPPTLMGRISNWFKDRTENIKVLYNKNYGKIVTIALYVSLLTLGGIAIYMSIDYGKYKILIEKLHKLSELNEVEASKMVESNENILEELQKEKEENSIQEIKKGGRHF